MKTKILYTALSIALIVIASDVYADGTKGEKKNKSSRAKTEKAVRLSENQEAEMRIEAWMTEIREFVTGDSFSEVEVNLENWMIESSNFNSLTIEPEVALEDWMTREFTMEFEEVNYDKAVELENWMINAGSFNEEFQEEEIQLESWMLNRI